MLGSSLAGRAVGAQIWPSVSRCLGVFSFGLRGPSPQTFTPFGKVGFIARRLRPPNKGNADGAVGIFGKCRAHVGYGPAPRPTEKRPCVTLARKVRRSTNTPVLSGPDSDHFGDKLISDWTSPGAE